MTCQTWKLIAKIPGLPDFPYTAENLTVWEVRAFLEGDLEVLEKLDPRMTSVDEFTGVLMAAPIPEFSREEHLDWLVDAVRYSDVEDQNGCAVRRFPLGPLFGVHLEPQRCDLCDGRGCAYCGEHGSRDAYVKFVAEQSIAEFTRDTGVRLVSDNGVDYYAEEDYVPLEESGTEDEV